jgi:parallel beta-helix repeat protein
VQGGIELEGQGSNLVAGDLIGTDITGSVPLGNGGDGIDVIGTSSDTIGGTSAGAENLISANSGAGVSISGGAAGANVLGNIIGTDISETLALGNAGSGIVIADSSDNVIGSTLGSGGNRIAGNQQDGLDILGGSSNTVVANTIGGTIGSTVNASISAVVGNARYGILIEEASGNNIGPANQVVGNGSDGIFVNISGTLAAANAITGNLVARNGQNGIELIGDLSGDQSLAQISDNLIGTTHDGTSTYDANGEPQGNGLSGILLESTSANTVQGKAIAATISGNVISDNGSSGVTVQSANAALAIAEVSIQSNLIGTDKSGQNLSTTSSTNTVLPFGNVLDGIRLADVSGVTIGGGASANSVSLTLATSGGNLIAGNLGRGIELDPGTQDTTISSNLIGVVFNLPTTFSGSVTSGSATITGIASTAGLVAGQPVMGNGIPSGATILSVDSSTGAITLSANATITGTPSLVTFGASAMDSRGTNAGNLSDGIFVLQATGNTISDNLISNNRGYGIHAESTSASSSIDLMITGNFIGTNGDGTSAVDARGAGLGNGADGVFLDAVGGVTVGPGNVISGNDADGVDVLDSSAVLISGNEIGTSSQGSSNAGEARLDLGNASDGIFINQSSSITVGGITNSARNIISGNHASGVFISGTLSTTSSKNLIEGNWIGVGGSPGPTAAVPNAIAGIILSNADDNIIGGATKTPGTGPGNVVSGNSLDGIVLVNDAQGNTIEGNLIGTDPTASSAIPNSADGIFLLGSGTLKGVTLNPTPSTITGNTIASNVIAGNNEDGIQVFGAGATANTLSQNWIGLSNNGTPIANAADGVLVNNAGPRNVVGGADLGNVISGNGQAGVSITDSPGATVGTIVEDNLIGTDLTGSSAVGNGSSGVLIYDASSNTIGGTVTGLGNTISGNSQAGVEMFNPGGTIAQAAGNRVLGNIIGTNSSGSSALHNGGNGVQIDGGLDNTIGGTAAGAGNVISANKGVGVLIDQFADGNQVLGNYIGTNAAGAPALGNGSDGVQIDNGSDNIIGGTMASARNVISGNAGNGVLIGQFPGLSAAGNQVLGNYIGTNPGGTSALSNTANGVELIDGSANAIGGTASGAGNVIAGNLQWGILFAITGASAGSPQSAIQGNDIGLDASRSYAIGNNAGGIFVNNITTQFLGQTIGGSIAGAGNLISGNPNVGIELFGPDATVSGTNNVIQANVIGLNAAGQVVNLPNGTIGNATGILASNSPDNLIGGDTATDRNVIAGNSVAGIELSGTGSTGNYILGNFIGTNIAGTAFPSGSDEAAPGQEVGVLINGASSNSIGGTAAGAGNVISGNAIGVELAGVPQSNSQFAGSDNVVAGNLIGTDATGTVAVSNLDVGVDVDNSAGNTIGPGNVISANGIAGVEILNSGSQHNLVAGNRIGESETGRIFSSKGEKVLDSNGSESGIQVFADAQNNGVVVIGASQNTIGQVKQVSGSAPNTISGNVQVGVYITRRDFQGKVYSIPVNNAVSDNTIQSNGIYGVLFYDAPNNKDRPFTGASPKLFKNRSGGNQIAFRNYQASFDAGTSLPTTSSGSKHHGVQPVTVRHHAAPKARIKHQPHPQGPATLPIPGAAAQTRHTTPLAAKHAVSINHRKHPG